MTNLDVLLLRGPLASGNVEDGMNDLRHTILSEGIPANSEGMSELRMYIWLILLNVPPLKTDIYLDLVQQGASPAHTKIQNDTFRTFQGDPLFRRRVTQNSITRVLNAVAWRLNDAHEARVNGWMSPPTLSEFGGSPDTSLLSRHSFTTGARTDASTTNDAEQIGYVQGMNVLCGPFLYAARSEIEAFAGFERLITVECPGYVRGSMDGVHKGLALVDRVLEVVDPKLYSHLMNNHMEARIYAFASVLTMCACTPPLPEVLQLWDFLFAYGPHLNILCIVAQLILIRDQILDSPSPNQILRNLPSLHAKQIIQVAMTFVAKIPEAMYEEIINHAK
ncbi:cell division control protein-like protein [Aaosphaeria arxii CBS 175.79]|uniref:Cell division control protein-like protein n=1 Tax=Aaosphaeria arxii CBS 175.79 TaxID=1450172 RepID=A0A6A5XM34_9PLEO|nr:cell division control protein-like protein [Aaosphaeria arxii CBS 175.79]KAF2013394.1 cell division control protein-like protein [Aaosphaeria arxii CBS 175.79]